MTKTAAMKIRISRSDRWLYILTCLVCAIMLIITVYPLYFIVIASFSDPNSVALGKISLLPDEINVSSYIRVLNHRGIWNSYRNTVFYTISYTLLSNITTMSAAFVFSRKNLVGSKICLFMVLFTMYFNGGMIPNYINIKQLKMMNTVWALIIPGIISCYNMIIARTYIQTSIPQGLEEAATIDGCSPIRYFMQIVLPLSTPIIGVLALYSAVSQWNSYFNALLYITNSKLYPLQIILRDILVNSEIKVEDMMSADINSFVSDINLKEQMKYALVVVASAPMMILYPFLQKFFVKGILVGSIKG